MSSKHDTSSDRNAEHVRRLRLVGAEHPLWPQDRQGIARGHEFRVLQPDLDTADCDRVVRLLDAAMRREERRTKRAAHRVRPTSGDAA